MTGLGRNCTSLPACAAPSAQNVTPRNSEHMAMATTSVANGSSWSRRAGFISRPYMAAKKTSPPVTIGSGESSSMTAPVLQVVTKASTTPLDMLSLNSSPGVNTTPAIITLNTTTSRAASAPAKMSAWICRWRRLVADGGLTCCSKT